MAMSLLYQLLIWAIVLTPAEYLFGAYPLVLASFERKQNAFLLLINACFIPVLTAVATVAAVLCLEAVVPDGFGAITGRQPFWLQIIEAVVLVDLGVYVSHRLLHTRYLWRFHEVHHSAEEMNWFVAFRFHPVDLGINAILTTIPAVLLGLSIEAIAVAKLINGWQSTISHANVWLGLGPLRRIFIDPGFHHWHHANDRDAYDRNFGGLLVVWDWLFGTLYAPNRKRVAKFGVDGPGYHSLSGLIIAPFRRPLPATSQGDGHDLPDIKHAPALSPVHDVEVERPSEITVARDDLLVGSVAQSSERS